MVLGIIAADILFILIAMYGLTAVVRMHPSFVIGARIIAALVLIGFGIRLLLASASALEFAALSLQSSASSLISGFAITLADPKAILFYMSLLPAFVDLSMATFADALIVTAAATAVIAAVKLNYAWLAGRAAGYFNMAQKPLHIIAGCTLLAIGTSVLLQH
jgi:threonine/homoserine/homoserine lactone efflux protein